MRKHRGVDDSGVRGGNYAEDDFGSVERGGDVRCDFYFRRHRESWKIHGIFAGFTQCRAESGVMNPQRQSVGTPAAAENDCERRTPASSADDGDFFHWFILPTNLILLAQLILLIARRTVKAETGFRAVHEPRDIRTVLQNNHERSQSGTAGYYVRWRVAGRVKQINKNGKECCRHYGGEGDVARDSHHDQPNYDCRRYRGPGN